MPLPFRILVSHSTRDTNVRVFWRFLEELQIEIDKSVIPIILVNIVSECGSMQVPNLPQAIATATAATDATMMVLTQGYIDSYWCDDEMHSRARSACSTCPSHRLFPLAWRTYPFSELWGRVIAGWGVDLQPLITDELLAQLETQLWAPEHRPVAWRRAIAITVEALQRFLSETNATCVGEGCPARIAETVAIPSRLD